MMQSVQIQSNKVTTSQASDSTLSIGQSRGSTQDHGEFKLAYEAAKAEKAEQQLTIETEKSIKRAHQDKEILAEEKRDLHSQEQTEESQKIDDAALVTKGPENQTAEPETAAMLPNTSQNLLAQIQQAEQQVEKVDQAALSRFQLRSSTENITAASTKLNHISQAIQEQFGLPLSEDPAPLNLIGDSFPHSAKLSDKAASVLTLTDIENVNHIASSAISNTASESELELTSPAVKEPLDPLFGLNSAPLSLTQLSQLIGNEQLKPEGLQQSLNSSLPESAKIADDQLSANLFPLDDLATLDKSLLVDGELAPEFLDQLSAVESEQMTPSLSTVDRALVNSPAATEPVVALDVGLKEGSLASSASITKSNETPNAAAQFAGVQLTEPQLKTSPKASVELAQSSTDTVTLLSDTVEVDAGNDTAAALLIEQGKAKGTKPEMPLKEVEQNSKTTATSNQPAADAVLKQAELSANGVANQSAESVKTGAVKVTEMGASQGANPADGALVSRKDKPVPLGEKGELNAGQGLPQKEQLAQVIQQVRESQSQGVNPADGALVSSKDKPASLGEKVDFSAGQSLPHKEQLTQVTQQEQAVKENQNQDAFLKGMKELNLDRDNLAQVSQQATSQVASASNTPNANASAAVLQHVTQAQTSLGAVANSLSAQQAQTTSQFELGQKFELASREAPSILRERITMMMNKGIGQAEIRLDPAELGSMHVKLSMQNDQLSVTIQAAQPQSKELLEQHMPRLREMLSQQGINLGDSQVSQQQSGSQHANQSSQGSGSGQGGGDANTNIAFTDEPELLSGQNYVQSNSAIDYYA